MKRTGISLLLVALLSAASLAFGADAKWTMWNKPRASFTMIAHRGAGDLAPENCMSSLELSWSMGATPEVDVRTTKDGRIVMFHDGNFARILPDAPEELKKKQIKDLTFDEARALDIGAFRGEKYKGEKIVSIEEIVEALKKGRGSPGRDRRQGRRLGTTREGDLRRSLPSNAHDRPGRLAGEMGGDLPEFGRNALDGLGSNERRATLGAI